MGSFLSDVFKRSSEWPPLKGAIGDCLQICFCYTSLKSLFILIAIIKLSGLNVFIYSVEGVRPRNVRPITTLGPSVLIVFPTCLSTYVLAYLCAPCSCRHTRYITIRAFTHAVQTEQEWQANINNPIFLSGIVVLLLNVAITFFHRWMTHVVVQWFIFPVLALPAMHICMSRLVNT